MTKEEKKKLADKKYREANKEKNKAWRKANKDKLCEYNKLWREINKEHKSKSDKEYKKQNSDKIKIANRVYNQNNKNKHNSYRKQRRETNPLFKLTLNIRSLIKMSIKRNGYKKNSKTNTILNCSFEEFKIHLESKFEPWMNWNNYGKYNGQLNYGWDIDHIIPVSTAKTEEDIIMLNHYTNLQPLCSKFNRDVKKALI